MSGALPEGITLVEVYETDDGQKHTTLIAAEYHQSRREIAALLVHHVPNDVDDVLNALSAHADTRTKVRGWLQNCERLEAVSRGRR